MDYTEVEKAVKNAVGVGVDMVVETITNADLASINATAIQDGEKLVKNLSKHITTKDEAAAAILTLDYLGSEFAVTTTTLSLVGVLTDSSVPVYTLSLVAVSILALADKYGFSPAK